MLTLGDPDDRIRALASFRLGRLAADHTTAAEALLAAWPLDLTGRPLTAAATLRAMTRVPGETALGLVRTNRVRSPTTGRTLVDTPVLDPRWRNLARLIEGLLLNPDRLVTAPSAPQDP